MEQGTKELRFQMFGRFALTYGGTELKLDKSGTSNMIQLLSMIVFRREGLPRDELLQNLYGNKSLADRSNNLRVTLFKLRKMLVQAGLPEESYVTLSGDIYRWATDIPTTCDVWDFRRLIREADEAQEKGDEEREFDLRLKACTLYCGELLPSIAYKDWVVMAVVSLKVKYTACLRRLCGLLEERGRYREIVELCTVAAQIYPFDEWQIGIIDALLAIKCYDEALAAYQRFTEFYYQELGLTPTEEMLARYQQICEVMHIRYSTADEIYREIQEKDVQWPGAVCVSYPSFIDRFRFLQRMSERSGESNFFLVVTLEDKSGVPLGISGAGSVPDEKVRGVLRENLRRTDTFTKFSGPQYLVLLVGIDQESVEIVTKRINEGLARLSGNLRAGFRYRAMVMRQPGQEYDAEGWHFAQNNEADT